jgi:hypothetical protein|eukprot:COSAG06_NODE_26037_length_623_cov_0.956107_2_plen_62_part_00
MLLLLLLLLAQFLRCAPESQRVVGGHRCDTTTTATADAATDHHPINHRAVQCFGFRRRRAV